ncbi:MAG: sigma-70 family RNA polymerase sigma factor [Nitriliruptorales bacterium]|nr:sigma-70 family RNA polymerase sigma factor [Nitriliruptorales bacterium]
MLNHAFPPVLAAAQTGAGWAFERLYRDLAPIITPYVRLRGAHDPEGLVNEVFLGVFKRLSSFSGDESSFRSWVFTIAHRRLIDERRRAAARPTTVGFGETDRIGGDVETEALDTVATQEVVRRFRGLSPGQRDVLLLRIVGGLTVDEIAQVVGKKPNAVKQLQRRGLEALRREISTEAVTL